MRDLDIRLKLLAVFTAAAFMVFVISFVKKRLLKENFAVLWLLFSFVMALLAANFNFVRLLSGLLGIADPNNTLFFLSIVSLIMLLILVCVEISDLSRKVKNLIQEVSILKSGSDHGKK